MAKRATLNPLKDNPRKLTQLTKDFMLAYIKAMGSEEDKQWFKEMIKTHTVTKTNNLDGKETKGLAVKEARREFAKRFFPQLLENVRENDFFTEVENL